MGQLKKLHEICCIATGEHDYQRIYHEMHFVVPKRVASKMTNRR